MYQSARYPLSTRQMRKTQGKLYTRFAELKKQATKDWFMYNEELKKELSLQ